MDNTSGDGSRGCCYWEGVRMMMMMWQWIWSCGKSEVVNNGAAMSNGTLPWDIRKWCVEKNDMGIEMKEVEWW